jgi:hypothetical protein
VDADYWIFVNPLSLFHEGEVGLRHSEPKRRLPLIQSFQFSFFQQPLFGHIRLHSAILLQKM